jgi:hypothetical protein
LKSLQTPKEFATHNITGNHEQRISSFILKKRENVMTIKFSGYKQQEKDLGQSQGTKEWRQGI